MEEKRQGEVKRGALLNNAVDRVRRSERELHGAKRLGKSSLVEQCETTLAQARRHLAEIEANLRDA